VTRNESFTPLTLGAQVQHPRDWERQAAQQRPKSGGWAGGGPR